MNIKEQNRLFSALDGLTSAEKDLLMLEGRVATTSVRLSREEALRAIGPGVLECDFESTGDARLSFAGDVIVRTKTMTGLKPADEEGLPCDPETWARAWAEAEAICEARGYGETVTGFQGAERIHHAGDEDDETNGGEGWKRRLTGGDPRFN